MIGIKSFTFNAFQENTYVVYDDTGYAAIIDAGNSNNQENSELNDFLKNQNFIVSHLLNTHCHIDHILGNWWVNMHYQLYPKFHPAEIPIANAAINVSKMYGVSFTPFEQGKIFLNEGDEIAVGNLKFKVIHIPGHSPGSIAFYEEEHKVIFSGDALFRGSIGRTDLLLGNHEQLLNSIKNKLFTLPDNVVVYSGHGGTTTIGIEKKTNPFFN